MKAVSFQPRIQHHTRRRNTPFGVEFSTIHHKTENQNEKKKPEYFGDLTATMQGDERGVFPRGMGGQKINRTPCPSIAPRCSRQIGLKVEGETGFRCGLFATVPFWFGVAGETSRLARDFLRGSNGFPDGIPPPVTRKPPNEPKNVEGHGRNENNCSVPWIG